MPEINPSLAKLKTEKPKVAVAVIATVGTIVLGQAIRRIVLVRRKGKLARKVHTEKIQAWKAEQDKQAELRKIEGEHSSFEPDTDGAYTLWVKGKTLGCSRDELQAVSDVLAQTMVEGSTECMELMDTNWSCKQRLLSIMTRVEDMELQLKLGDVWTRALKCRRQIWYDNFSKLLHVMRRTCWSRVCRLAVTVSVAYFADEVSSASSEAYDQWTESVVGEAVSPMLKWATHYLVVSLMEGMLDTLSSRLTMYLSASFKKEVDRSLYTNLVTQDTSFFDVHTAEEIEHLSAITEDLHEADEKLHRTVRQLVRAACRTRHLWKTDRRLFLAVTIMYAVYESVSRRSTQLVEMFNLEAESKEERSTLAGLCGSLSFIMDHIKLLRVNGREHELVQELVQRRADDDDDVENQYSLQQRVVETNTMWLLAAIRCAGLWFGANHIVKGNDDIQMESYLAQTFLLCSDWQNMDFMWLKPYAANTATLVDMLDTKPNIEKEGGLIPHLFKGKIEFRDVHFAYPARPDIKVLKGVSFTINAGETVAFVGQSGSGKSTVMCLLQRLYAPTKGQILLDDVPIEQYDIRWLRGQVGVVLQETVLFDMTVEENIKLGNPKATQEDVIAAAKVASAFDFIIALPAGLQTKLGHGNVNLSGGQKQRINIARAVVKNPSMLLLDEFTSALDNTCESAVVAALSEAMAGRTVVSIAHRLGAMANVDRVMVFQKGSIVEQGPPEELHQQGGLFAKLSENPASRGNSVSNLSFGRGSLDMSNSFGRQVSVTGFEEEAPDNKEDTSSTSISTEAMRDVLGSWEEVVKFVQALNHHPDVQQSLNLKKHICKNAHLFERRFTTKKEQVEPPAAPVDFRKQCGTRAATKWNKVQNALKMISMSRLSSLKSLPRRDSDVSVP